MCVCVCVHVCFCVRVCVCVFVPDKNSKVEPVFSEVHNEHKDVSSMLREVLTPLPALHSADEPRRLNAFTNQNLTFYPVEFTNRIYWVRVTFSNSEGLSLVGGETTRIET